MNRLSCILGLQDGDGEFVGLAGDVEVEPAPPLRVVTAAQAGHTLRALLVHVHITGCNGGCWIKRLLH